MSNRPGLLLLFLLFGGWPDLGIVTIDRSHHELYNAFCE